MVPKQVIEKVEKKISQSKAAKATGSARTKARKERRELATLAAHPLPMVVNSSKKKRPHLAYLGARAASLIESEEAKAYFDSLLVPESGSAQYPDLSDFPTVPISSRFTVSLNPIQQATTNKVYSVFVLSANIYDMYNQATAIDASGSISYSSNDSAHPLLSGYLNNFAQYRPISMCARVINSTNLNNKQGLLYQDLGTPIYSGQISTGSYNRIPNVASMPASPTVSIGAFANEYLEDVPRTCWMPLKLNSLEFIPTDANPSNGNWIAQSSEVPYIALMVDHQTTDMTKAQVVTVEVFFNFEAVPLYSTQSLFDPRTCVGDPSKTALGLLENKNALLEGVNSTVSQMEKIIGGFERFRRVAEGFGIGASGSSTLSSAFTRTIHLLKDNLTDDIQSFSSEEKSVNAILDSLKKIQVLLKQLDPRGFKVVPHYVNTAPWKKELVAVDVVSRVPYQGEEPFSVISPRTEKSFRSGSTSVSKMK